MTVGVGWGGVRVKRVAVCGSRWKVNFAAVELVEVVGLKERCQIVVA